MSGQRKEKWVAGGLPVTYRLIKISESKRKTVFILRAVSGDTSVTRALKGFTFIFDHKKHGNFRSAWWKTSWTEAEIETASLLNEALLRLTSNKGVTELAVQVRNNGKGKKGEAVAALTQAYPAFDDARTVAHQRSQVDISRVAPDGFGISRFSDSLFCFFENSQQLMDKKVKEDTLSFEEWIDYFNGNNELMLARYSELNGGKTEVVKSCLEEARLKKMRDSIAVTANVQQALNDQSAAALTAYTRSVSVNLTGVWNCDQLARLREPEFVRANYVDEKGKSLDIIMAYLIDGSLNGALLYNGYMDNTPQHFPYSPFSSNTLLVFDFDGNAYVFSSDKFDEVNKTKPKYYTFKVRALKKMEKSDDLRDALKAKP